MLSKRSQSHSHRHYDDILGQAELQGGSPPSQDWDWARRWLGQGMRMCMSNGTVLHLGCDGDDCMTTGVCQNP